MSTRVATEFGAQKAVDFIPGAEILGEPNDDEGEEEAGDVEDSDEEGWVDVPESGK